MLDAKILKKLHEAKNILPAICMNQPTVAEKCNSDSYKRG